MGASGASCYAQQAIDSVKGRLIDVHVLSEVGSRVRDFSLRGSAKDHFDLRMVGVLDLFNLNSALEI